jgi:tol-pal system protein YbgF
MYDFYTNRGCTVILMAFTIMAIPACGSFKGMSRSNEDPQVAALQREMRQIAKSNAATQGTIEDIYDRLDALEAKVTGLENTVEDLATPPEPGTATAPETKPSPPKVAPEPPPPEVKTEPATIKEAKESTPKKPVKITRKKAILTAKRSQQRDYDKAYAAYMAHRYDEALALFKDFLQRYPQHHLADNAQYWVGEIYYDIENYPNAILAFKEVVTRYGKENKAPDALLKIGYAYVALDDPSNARIFLKRVIKNYPFSEAEAKARAKLKELENL